MASDKTLEENSSTLISEEPFSEEPRKAAEIYGYLYANSLYGRDFNFHRSYQLKEPIKSYEFFCGNAPVVYNNGRQLKTRFHESTSEESLARAAQIRQNPDMKLMLETSAGSDYRKLRAKARRHNPPGARACLIGSLSHKIDILDPEYTRNE